jgi:CBS domain-containing protein
MRVGEVCRRAVVTVHRETPLVEAARMMRETHVGSLVVVESHDGRRPEGLITDRDIVVAVVAKGVDARTLTVGEVMGGTLATAREDEDAMSTLRAMRRRGVRRMPVVSTAGEVVGIITIDDLLETVAEQLGEIVAAIGREQELEAVRRR